MQSSAENHTIWLQIHSTERDMLHESPCQNRHPIQTAAKLESVVDFAGGSDTMDRFVEGDGAFFLLCCFSIDKGPAV